MATNSQHDTKFLKFRISREIWIRLGNAVRRAGTTTQAFCNEALERHLERAERKQAGLDDLDAKSVRHLRGKSSSGAE
jgi:predicted DNA-binding protein